MRITNEDRDYVLGTHDEEIARLGLQHRIWRPQALEGWKQGGFTVGQTLLDIGSGPGYASLDLARIVGPTGQIQALDRSQRFLSALQTAARLDQLENITTHELDLDKDPFPAVLADGAWVRWVFAFVTRPRDLVTRIGMALRPGGTIVIHEYFHYETWRFAPRSPLFEEFVATVMRSWRTNGGEPDIGLDLPVWLDEAGFRVTSLRPIIEVITPSSFIWPWPRAFVAVGLKRLVDLGEVTEQTAAAIRDEFAVYETAPGTRMVTPAVLEIVAAKL